MAIDYAALAAGMSQANPFNCQLGPQTVTLAPDRGMVDWYVRKSGAGYHH